MRKTDSKGNPLKQHGTFIEKRLLETEAFRKLTGNAKSLYLWLRLEWKGKRFCNNGNIRLSQRQAAKLLGVSVNTAAKAFYDLQAKGFIVVTKLGMLGVAGMGRATEFELTEIALANHRPRRLYLKWAPGNDYEIVKRTMGNSQGSKK